VPKRRKQQPHPALEGRHDYPETTEKQLDELYEETSSNADPKARKKCLVVYLRAMGRPRREIADIARVDEDTRPLCEKIHRRRAATAAGRELL
jgi:hypothetical protein